jgi:hypothetical protein
MEPTDAIEPIDPTDAIEPIDPTDVIEPTLNSDQMLNAEPTLSIDS